MKVSVNVKHKEDTVGTNDCSIVKPFQLLAVYLQWREKKIKRKTCNLYDKLLA